MKVAKVDFTWAYLELSLLATSVTGADDTNIRGAIRAVMNHLLRVNDNARKTRDYTWDKAKLDEEHNLYKDCLWGISTVKTIFLVVLTMLNSISIINFIAVHI